MDLLAEQKGVSEKNQRGSAGQISRASGFGRNGSGELIVGTDALCSVRVASLRKLPDGLERNG